MLLNGNGAPQGQQLAVKCGMMPIPGGFKCVYTDASGAILMAVDVLAPNPAVVGPLLSDLGQRMSKQLVAAPAAMADALTKAA